MGSWFSIVPLNEITVEKAWMFFHKLENCVPCFLGFINLVVIFYMILNFLNLARSETKFIQYFFSTKKNEGRTCRACLSVLIFWSKLLHHLPLGHNPRHKCNRLGVESTLFTDRPHLSTARVSSLPAIIYKYFSNLSCAISVTHRA
jgi:hypothetical protein